MGKMFGELRKKAGEEPVKPAVTAKAKETPEEASGNHDESPPESSSETTEAAPESTEAPASEPTKGKKLSPWKLVDEHKAARLKAETEIAELRKSMAPPEKVKEIEEKYAAVEKRARELEDHMRFVDYSKSAEFQEKYQKPYEQAWQRWMSDLGELTVSDASGGERPIAATDLLELVNLPLQKARESAETTFGAFADDVMSARKEIRSLFDQQQRALTEAKTAGAERMKQQQQAWQQQQDNLRKEITTTWQESNKSAMEDPNYGKFLKPIEGDDEGNQRLQKGYEMADRAFAVNPSTPGLTPQQRAEIVRLHAAIRNRAAGFGRLAYQNQKLEAKLAELTATLNKYRSAEPGLTESRHEQSGGGGGTAMERMQAELRKRAH